MEGDADYISASPSLCYIQRLSACTFFFLLTFVRTKVVVLTARAVTLKIQNSFFMA